MYSKLLKEKSEYYWGKNPILASLDSEFDKLIRKETEFLDSESPLMRHRLYCVVNNIHRFPTCPVCGGAVHLHDKDPKKGFRKLCSQVCRSTNNKISADAQEKLDSYDWLYEQRITKKWSKERIAGELGISVVPVNKAIKKHKLPNVRYNESDVKTRAKLEDKQLLERIYAQDKTMEEIAEIVGSSKATVSLFFAKHGIEPREPNYYERKFAKISAEEQSVVDWIKSVYTGDVLTNKKNIAGKNLELDIYIPAKNFGIEYNGLYSHIYRPNEESYSIQKGPQYHYNKTMSCRNNGVFLFHLWSDLWLHQQEKVKFYLMNKLGVNKKVYARNCIIKDVSVEEKNSFLDKYHLQGSDKSKLKFGLYHNGELVSLMTFSTPNRTRSKEKYDWELKRFCSKGGINVVGGFSKLLSHFRKSFEGTLVSYADLSYSDGGVYAKNGFELIAQSGPSYQYVNLSKGVRMPKTSFTKSQLIAQLGESVEELSEREIMVAVGVPILYDCGTATYVLRDDVC